MDNDVIEYVIGERNSIVTSSATIAPTNTPKEYLYNVVLLKSNLGDIHKMPGLYQSWYYVDGLNVWLYRKFGNKDAKIDEFYFLLKKKFVSGVIVDINAYISKYFSAEVLRDNQTAIMEKMALEEVIVKTPVINKKDILLITRDFGELMKGVHNL